MAEKAIEFEVRRVCDLHEREGNPHLHDDGQMELLRGSIREFGFLAPVLIDAEGCVVDGELSPFKKRSSRRQISSGRPGMMFWLS